MPDKKSAPEPVPQAVPAKPEPDETPGKTPEAAAASGAESDATPPGQAPLGQGAQVILTGDARDAARGGPHDDITTNTLARDSAIAAGHVADGTTAKAAEEATSGMPKEVEDPSEDKPKSGKS